MRHHAGPQTVLSAADMGGTKKKILITGISGLLGSNLAYCWRERCQILGLYHTHPWKLKGIETAAVDLADADKTAKILKDFQPDIIVHCAAIADVDKCETDQELAIRTNVTATKNLTSKLPEHCKFVYISTDLVYNGVKGHFTETDPVKPINVYGQTKFTGEVQALLVPKALVARTNFFGWNVQNKECFAERVAREAPQNTVKGFTDSTFSSIYTFDLADILEQAILKDLSGIYNMTCQGSMTRFAFAEALSDRLCYRKGVILRSSINDFPFKAKRAKDLSLVTEKLSIDLDLTLPTMEDSIEHFVNDFHSGVAKLLKTS